MSIDVSGLERAQGVARHVHVRTDAEMLRRFAVTAGIGWAIAFVVIGPWYALQTYADGSIFSYAVAVEDAWAFHWHNIVGRVFVFLVSLLPAELYVGLTHDAGGGVVLYGVLFFAGQLLGLAATYAADRSPGRVIFAVGCLSTACLCPLVFGFPTEMWMAHAVFWPALALAHYARGIGGTAAVFLALLALVFSYEGGIILAFAIVATLALREVRGVALTRAAAAMVLVLAIWLAAHVVWPPDGYFAPVLSRAAQHVFDITVFTNDLMLLVYAALAGYGLAFLVLRPFHPTRAHLYAAGAVALALSVYWLRFDQSLHAENRYYLRTLLFLALPLLGMAAAGVALAAEGRLDLVSSGLARLKARHGTAARAAIGALALLMLVHTVETAKFVAAWNEYTRAVRALAMSTRSDPALGHPRFVSAARLGEHLNRLSWFSTTPFLSVLLAPHHAPARLVVDPTANYFWLACATARENLAVERAVPVESRRLILAYTCLHR